MKKTKDFVILPFNSARLKNKYLVSNVLGAWDFLGPAEFKQFSAFGFSKESPFFSRLKERGLVADDSNIQSVIESFRNTNENLFLDTSLHIAVVTTRCNLSCSYCQAKTPHPKDMSYEVAAQVLKYMFDVRNPSVTLEFQGGEPLLNWPVVKFMIESARKINTTGKNLKITIVSNLLLLDEEKMKVLAKHNVDVCTSLDGPQKIHDTNRISAGGQGTYQQVVRKIKIFKDKFGKSVSLLPTITKDSLKNPKAIIDEYVKWGQKEIALRPVNNMGTASCSWASLGYSPEEFCDFYSQAMEYILKFNQEGIFIRERTANLILTKVLAKKDHRYVDLLSPCGAGRLVMAYMPDGSCYPCDEARMLNEDMFKLGNILNEKYDDMMKKENLLHLLEASCSNLWNYASVYSPWMGVCPVVNYALQKNVIPKVACSPMQKILTFQFEYIFGKILSGGDVLKTFNRWVEGEGYGQKK
ncbi:MAG: His-Xaa-Ser system radical SAM maturase HxsB [Candidatus Omnitrophica bacterium]|nr:His-Xaa-Ser system radical SAM maturase HxsB [Candidatus Omnitrophota bacterium]